MKNCERLGGHSEAQQAARNMGRRRRRQVPMVRQRGLENSNSKPCAGNDDSAQRQHHHSLLSPPSSTKVTNTLPFSHSNGVESGLAEVSNHGASDEGDRDTRIVASDDGRVACSNCRRRFSADRVGVHEEICKRVNTDKPKGRKKMKRIASVAVGCTRQSSCPVVFRNKATRARKARGLSLDHEVDKARFATSADTRVCVCVDPCVRVFACVLPL